MALTFAEVLKELLETNTNGIGSVNALANKLYALRPRGDQASLRKMVRKHLAGREPREPTIELYTRAFKVKRSVFPASVSLKDSMSSRLASLVAESDRQQSTLERILAALKAAGIAVPDPPAEARSAPTVRP